MTTNLSVDKEGLQSYYDKLYSRNNINPSCSTLYSTKFPKKI